MIGRSKLYLESLAKSKLIKTNATEVTHIFNFDSYWKFVVPNLLSIVTYLIIVGK